MYGTSQGVTGVEGSDTRLPQKGVVDISPEFQMNQQQALHLSAMDSTHSSLGQRISLKDPEEPQVKQF